MKIRCRLRWHRYDHHVVKIGNGVRMSEDQCECGAYRNFAWEFTETPHR